ncbi:hypothetical protein CCP3SC1_310001 [Gammaproteobacteria bacterium]
MGGDLFIADYVGPKYLPFKLHEIAFSGVQAAVLDAVSKFVFRGWKENFKKKNPSKMLLSGSPKPTARVRKRATNVREDSQALKTAATNSIGEFAATLHPPLLDFFGLDAALNNLAYQFSQYIGIPVRVRSSATSRRHEAIESTIYRIAQEALTNCTKHANARAIDINLADAGDWIVLTIADDGVGFDLDSLGGAKSTTSLGLLTMRERTEFAGGNFHLESAPGQGTTVRVEIPSTCIPVASVKLRRADMPHSKGGE